MSAHEAGAPCHPSPSRAAVERRQREILAQHEREQHARQQYLDGLARRLAAACNLPLHVAMKQVMAVSITALDHDMWAQRRWGLTGFALSRSGRQQGTEY